MLTMINPATEEVIGQLPTDTAESLQSKYAQLAAFQPKWNALGFEKRAKIVAAFNDRLQEHKKECAEILMREMGKPFKQALSEVEGTHKRLDFFIKNTAACLKDDVVLTQDNVKEVISYEPLGVVGNISAWNYPYFVGTNVFIPALLTGNTVLYKPSELTAMTGLKIAELLYASGLPKEALQVVVGGGDVGKTMLALPLAGLFFTGSYATGKKVSEALGGRFLRTGYELGGKDPVYICDDIDIAKTAEMVADGAFYNAGQSCCAVERIYVHEKIYDRFVEEFATVTRRMAVMGDPQNEKTYLGPLARKPQLAVLEDQVSDAVRKGAKVVVSGGVQKGKGWYFAPVVLSNVNHSMKIMRDESFGPVVGIMKVADDTEAVRHMNDTEYGLTASVYTKDEKRGERVLSQVDAGTVYWNACDRVSPHLPWTGRRHSGIGSTGSKIGIQAFVQPKAHHWITRD